MRKILFSLWVWPLVLFCGCSQQRSTFPSKPITIVVPWDAGGGTDALARSLAVQASKSFDQVVNVLNRSGGAGAIGHSFGATARPDGYTVTMITYELCTYAPLERVDLSPLHFKPVVQLNEDPAAITVRSDSPWKTLAEFLDYARDHPNQVTVGNSGPGAVWHIGALKLEKWADVQFKHIPHNGAKPAVTQLLGGHIDAVSVSPAEVLQYLQLGTLRCLGIMSEERMANLPDVPTCREQGIDLVHGTWRGLAVPPETPDEIVTLLEQGFKEGYDSSEFQETAHKALLGLKYRDAAQFKDFLKKEFASVTELFSDSDLVVQSGDSEYMIPRFYAWLLLIFCVVLAIPYKKQGSSQAESPEANMAPGSLKIIAISFAVLVLYSLLMFVLGYLVSTLLYLAVMFVLLGERRPVVVGSLSIVIVFVVYIVFQSILNVPIPGLWG